MLDIYGRVARNDLLDIQAHAICCLLETLDSQCYDEDQYVKIIVEFVERIGEDWQEVADAVAQSRKEAEARTSVQPT